MFVAEVLPKGVNYELESTVGARIHPPRSTLGPARLFVAGMHEFVTTCAQSDEVVLGVVSELTPRVNVMDLESARASAALAAPAVPLQYLLAEAFIGFLVQPKPRPS